MWQYSQGGSLIHYGVKGRSGKPGAGLWYKNGELTEAGKRHYYGEGNGNSRKEKIKNTVKNLSGGNQKDKPESATWKSKDARYLSDAELNRRNSRLDREKHYKDMTKSRGQKAASWIKKTAGVILVAALVETAKNKMANNYKQTLDTYGPKAVDLIKNKARTMATAAMINIGSRRA